MKVYFTASIVGKRRYLPEYLTIIRHFRSKGATVMSDHIIKASEDVIRMETKKERLAFHKQLEDWIRKADMMVVEATFPSISVGYEISLALQMQKPVLILYKEGDAPSLLSGHANERLYCEKYSPKTVTAIIDDFITFAQASVDTRFTFFITPDIARHLEKVASKQHLPKSVYLRKLIERDMQKTS